LFVLLPGEKPQMLELEVAADQATRLGLEPGPLNREQVHRALQVDGTSMFQLLTDPHQADSATPRLAELWTLLIPENVRQALVQNKIRRLLVVPDGPLALLPFETLVVETGAEPEFLLDVGPPIQYVPSATIFFNLIDRKLEPTPADLKPVLTVARPNYASTPQTEPTDVVAQVDRARYSASASRLSDLPHTSTEAAWVIDCFNKQGTAVGKLLESDATEARVRFNVRGRKIVHLACHGLTDHTFANFFGALAFTPGEASKAADDGFLTLPEIYELNLKSCELAILSACQTNYGPQQQGEGTWALSRGFLVAGSKRVVASNWLVDDEAAASLIYYFCSDVAQSQSSADHAAALQKAKRRIREQEKWKSPYYWGTFVLIGPN
jgi:CHAT domain-containing protein